MEFCNEVDKEEKIKITAIDTISKELGKLLPPPHKFLKMVVIIPAKNESGSIRKTLISLVGQKKDKLALFQKSCFEILVLCHNCSDDTYRNCKEVVAEYPETLIHILTLNSEVANTVGAARRVLMNIASERLKIPNGLIVSTDADTLPDPYWLFYLETYLNKNVALICGLIKVDLKGLTQQAKTYLKAKDEYLLLKTELESRILPNENDPWPKHCYHWGPNLAIKKDVYEAVGGIRPLHFLEDVNLYYKVFSKGFVVRHCLKVKVTTSTRIDSRCLEGFGAELKVWTENQGVCYNVEGFEKLLCRFKIYMQIQKFCSEPSEDILMEISDNAFMDKDFLECLFEKNHSFEARRILMEMHLNVSKSWNAAHANVGVLDACSQLNTYLGKSQMAIA